MMRVIKRFIWLISGIYAAIRFPISNKNYPFVAITGTDGKTTTGHFIYEAAKDLGYNPLLITTVGCKFKDKYIDVKFKSDSFIAFSFKGFLSNFSKGNVFKAIKYILFLEYSAYESNKEKHRTTPLASEIRKLIKKYKAFDANYFIIEVTSHALDQFRVWGIRFDSVGFTNITREHLDYHGTWDNYAKAKASLINQLKKSGYVSINTDDRASYNFLSKYCKDIKLEDSQVISYSKDEELDTRNFYIDINSKGGIYKIHASNNSKIHSWNTKLNLIGEYNISNSLCALGVVLGGRLQQQKEQNIEDFHQLIKIVIKSFVRLKNIEGRMELVESSPYIMVDFAHTPNGMLNALKSIRLFMQKNNLYGNLWVIFGCAGLRDHYKRSQMGQIAYEYGDRILVVPEDPRTENVSDINDQIVEEIDMSNKKIDVYNENYKYSKNEEKLVIRFDTSSLESRKNAINFAMDNASKEDLIILLGKGHETSMCFGTDEVDWNDISFIKSRSSG